MRDTRKIIWISEFHNSNTMMVCSEIAYPTRRVIDFIIEIQYSNIIIHYLFPFDPICFYIWGGKVIFRVGIINFNIKFNVSIILYQSSPQLKLPNGPNILLKFLLCNCDARVCCMNFFFWIHNNLNNSLRTWAAIIFKVYTRIYFTQLTPQPHTTIDTVKCRQL